jgi:hypothetical protein
MTCSEFRHELSRWLESRWDPDIPGNRSVPKTLERHAASCESCSGKLRSAVSLVGMKEKTPAPPPYLSSKIKSLIAEQDGVPAGRRTGAAIVWGASLAAAMLVAALLLFVFMPGRNGGSETINIRFTLAAPEAGSVKVVGDWNGWDPDADLLKDEDGDGVWEAEIELERGNEYRYQFLIDNERWIADPKAPLTIDDGFGGRNSVLNI